MYKRHASWDRVSTEIEQIIDHFKLESRNNDVSMTTTRTQIVKEFLFQQRIHRTEITKLASGRKNRQISRLNNFERD